MIVNMERRNSFFWLLAFWSLFSINPVHAQSIKIEGNESASSRALKKFVVYPENFGEYNGSSLKYWKDGILDEILSYYESLGFFEVSAYIKIISKSTGIELQSNSKLKLSSLGSWQTLIVVVEGPRYSFGNVTISTLDDSDPLVQLADLKSQDGKNFSFQIAQEDKEFIDKKYGEKGYAKRKVQIEFDVSDSLNKVDVSFEVDPSYLIIFDTLIIDNRRESRGKKVNGVTRQGFMRNLLPFERGDTLNLSEANSFKKKLKSTKSFNYVRIRDSLLIDKEMRSAIIVRTEERIPGSLGGNVFWETEDGFGMGTYWSHKNILGRFYHGMGKLRLAQRRQKITLGLGNPLLFGSSIKSQNELDLVWRQEIRPEESPFDALLSSSLIWIFNSHWSAFSKLELVSTTNNTRERVLDLNWINSLKMSYVDDVINPRRGVQLKWIHGNGGPLLDANEEFRLAEIRHNWFEMNSSFYFPMLSNYILALRLDGGSFLGKGWTNSRRFYLGGNSSIRNKDAGELCPERTLNEDSGLLLCREDLTPIYYLTSLEIRAIPFYHKKFSKISFWRHFKYMQFVPFVDYGRIWDKSSSQNEDGKGFDLGLGVRVPILLFDLRFDYAVGWDKGPDFSDNRIVVDLAQAF